MDCVVAEGDMDVYKTISEVDPKEGTMEDSIAGLENGLKKMVPSTLLILDKSSYIWERNW